MNDATLLTELERLAQACGVELRYERLQGRQGGLCRIYDRQVLFLDAGDSVRAKITHLAAALAPFDLDEVFVLPSVRALIERARAATRRTS